MSRIGILQGRLSHSPEGKFQFYPPDWQAELKIARKLGFDGIEWLFDGPGYQKNALWSRDNWDMVRRTAVEEEGVFINSVCADYFMTHRLWGPQAKESIRVLKHLVEATNATTRLALILVPLLEDNALKTEEQKEEVILNLLRHVLPAMLSYGTRIAFETEMPIDELEEFINRIQDPSRTQFFGAYYDIGNCTSYGFDCPTDIEHLKKRSMLFGVHIKDRKVGSTQSVPLGSGDADFPGCFRALKGSHVTPILQAWRTNETYVQDAREQLHFLQTILEKVNQ